MSENVPKDLLYSKTHAWVRTLSQGSVEVGITDHAQSSLGDLIFSELPAVGVTVRVGIKSAVVESNKAASDVESPVSGRVTANNASLGDNPELVNDDPYVKGWLYRVSLSETPSDLLSPEQYAKLLAQ
jgi:glycine cleavage system H protein